MAVRTSTAARHDTRSPNTNACSSGQDRRLESSTRLRSDVLAFVPDTHTDIADGHAGTSTARLTWHEATGRVAEMRAANAALAAKVQAVMRLRAARCIEQGGSSASIEQGGCPRGMCVHVRDACAATQAAASVIQSAVRRRRCRRAVARAHMLALAFPQLVSDGVVMAVLQRSAVPVGQGCVLVRMLCDTGSDSTIFVQPSIGGYARGMRDAGTASVTT